MRGPKLSGRVLPGGAGGLYFRTSPTFETEAADLQWLMQHVFVGTGAVVPNGIELRWFRVL